MHIRYAAYVLRHKWYVLIEACKLGCWWRGLLHDLSKFRLDEWVPYARYFYGDYPDWRTMPTWAKYHYTGRTKQSLEREFDIAWLLHQKRNKHHWQWWILPLDDGGTKVLPMPDQYRREMLADWRGAGKALGYGDNTFTWYQENATNMQLHPDTRTWIEKQLGLVACQAPTVA